MKCPNCEQPGLKTIETFQLNDKTIRTKKCPECKWTFTSVEEISDSLVIPKSVRRMKRRNHETNVCSQP